jgi:hypothetical protein
MDVGLYSQHFIFFVTYEWAQKAGVKLPSVGKVCQGQTLLLIGPFVSYKDNEVLLI